jgi:hypothetical protein
VIVAFRDSITDGTCSTLDAHDRWEDILALRLALQETGRWALVNEGIGGNTLPPKVNALIVPVASAAPRTRGPMLALSNTTGPGPNVLSTRTLTLVPRDRDAGDHAHGRVRYLGGPQPLLRCSPCGDLGRSGALSISWRMPSKTAARQETSALIC